MASVETGPGSESSGGHKASAKKKKGAQSHICFYLFCHINSCIISEDFNA